MQTESPTGACVERRARLKLQAGSAAATTNFPRNIHFGERGAGGRRKSHRLYKKIASPSTEASCLAVSWFVGTAVPLLLVFFVSHQL